MYIVVIIICAIVLVILAGMFFHSQNHAVDQICEHPELSDEHTRAIAEVSSNNYKILKIFDNFIKITKK